MIESLQVEHYVQNVLLVADRAMFTEENLSLMEQLGVTYIVAAKLRSLPKQLKSKILSSEYTPGVVCSEFQWINEFEHKSRRLIVAYSAKRARKDAADRQRLITRLMKKIKGGKIKLKELIPNYGSRKYVSIENDNATLNQARIEQDAQWDGLHGVITNSTEKNLTNILGRYRELWQIEEAFRISKHDLKMRPIYHWTEKRIKAHVAICFIAYALAKQAVYRVSLQQETMSFEQIRNELLHAQSSIVRDLQSKKNLVIPSNLNRNQKKIYQTFAVRRSNVPYAIV
jgi:transposase